MASRYLATVRRATGMPSLDRSSAMRLSLSGASVHFVADELADLGADGGGGGAGAVGSSRPGWKRSSAIRNAARRVHVFAGGHARNRRFVHADGVGDVAQDHRPHVLLALFQERGLALDDAARHLQQGLVADFQALQQPARFLQLRAQLAWPAPRPSRLRVAFIDAHLRQAWRRSSPRSSRGPCGARIRPARQIPPRPR